jgi:hypothetical protein
MAREVTVATEEGEIIEEIRSAFAGVPRGATTIHEAEVMDVYGTDAQRQEARRIDTEEQWDEIHPGSIADCTAALSYLDPEAWRFYLPAYMTWTLRHFHLGAAYGGATTVPDHTIYSLDLSGHDPGVREHKMERFRLLDEAQSRAVCRFLYLMAEHDDRVDADAAIEALAAYWHRFEG